MLRHSKRKEGSIKKGSEWDRKERKGKKKRKRERKEKNIIGQ